MKPYSSDQISTFLEHSVISLVLMIIYGRNSGNIWPQNLSNSAKFGANQNFKNTWLIMFFGAYCVSMQC